MSLSDLSKGATPESPLNPPSPIAVVESYLAANNRHDIAAVTGFLAEEIKVTGPNGDTWASSRADVLPFYLKDFERAKRAGLAKLINTIGIRELDGGGSVDAAGVETRRVWCLLENRATAQIVDVTYFLRSSDAKMIKHVISSIEDSKIDHSADG